MTAVLTPIVALVLDPMGIGTQWARADDPVTPTPPVAVTGSVTRPVGITLNFKDASIDAVLDHLSEAAGFIVVKEAPAEGRVTLLSKQPVTPEEAVSLLNTVLKGNGYTAIQTGRILKIVSREKAKKGNLPVHFGGDPLVIAETDDLITQVIPIRSMDAVKLKNDLQPLVGADADLSSNAASNTLIITDTSANIRRVVEIVASMDKRDATENGIVVRQLKYADATATAKLITDMFKTDDTSAGAANQGPAAFFRGFGGGRGGGGFGGGGPGGGGGGGNNSSEDSDKGKVGKITASADTRTNTVVVAGPADTLKVIEDLLTKLDANPAADQTFFIYHVKNGQAVDMQTTLNSLFSGQAGTSNGSSLGTRTSYNSQTGNKTSSGFGGSNSSGFGGGGSGLGAGSSGFGGESSSNRGGTSGSSSTSANGNRGTGTGAPGTTGAGTISGVAELIGQVLVVADTDTNSLLVSTATKYEKRVRELILELDRPVPQVLIKVLIAEVTHDNSDDLGLDFSVLNLRASGNGQSIGSNLGNAASSTANGGLAVSVLESNLTATFHALATAGKLDVLSRPYILASDNQEADITVGQEVPFITDSRVTDTGQTINTIQYQDIGIILDVTPHINPDGLVIMDVSPQISSQSDQSVPIQPGVNAPVFNQRSADSRVGIRDGETIVIGGLMQDQKTQTITKIPLLGDIPLLGLLFHRNQVTKTKTELLIFLTPHVAQAADHLRPMSIDEMRSLRLTPAAVEPGTFQDHLRGLQLGGSATTQPTPAVPAATTAPAPATTAPVKPSTTAPARKVNP
jgi:general secretion pathway protein D